MLSVVLAIESAPGQDTEIALGPPPWNLQPRVRMALQTLATRFQTERADIHVMVTGGLESFDAQSVEPRDLGNVMFIPGAEYGQPSILACLAERGVLVDLTERTSAATFGKADFFPNLWDLVTYTDRIWAVPLLVRSWGIAVDTSRLDGGWAAQQFRSWETFLAGQPEFVVDENGDGAPEFVEIQSGLSPYTLWSCRFLSLGGDPSNSGSFSS
jgi:hypothetical protein